MLEKIIFRKILSIFLIYNYALMAGLPLVVKIIEMAFFGAGFLVAATLITIGIL